MLIQEIKIQGNVVTKNNYRFEPDGTGWIHVMQLAYTLQKQGPNHQTILCERTDEDNRHNCKKHDNMLGNGTLNNHLFS